MKYIRTNDGVYEVKREELLCGVKFYDYETGDWLNRIRDEFIIKQSEDLEELCDEFVFVNKVGKFDKTYVIHYNMPNHIFTEPTIEEKIAYIKDVYKDELDNIKGAIYTGKGLIYVAKMNDRGELVLI